MQGYRIDRPLKPPSTRGMRRLGFVAALCCAAASACGRHASPYVARIREARGVLISVAAWGPDSARLDHAVAAALDSAAAAETALASLGARPGSQGVSPGLARLVLRALALARASDGAFDPVAGRFRALTVDTARATVTLPRGVHVDLGELGRGYALDRVLAALHGAADSAVISSGGQYLIHSAWSGARVVGIGDPNHTLAPQTRLLVPAGTWAVSTMSVAEAQDEVLDPRTGKPATRTRVVAAMAPDAADAGGWSAAFYVMGCDSALALAPRVHMSVVCVDDDVRWSSDLDGRVKRDTMREQ